MEQNYFKNHLKSLNLVYKYAAGHTQLLLLKHCECFNPALYPGASW